VTIGSAPDGQDPKVAGLLGVWEGKWNDVLGARLIVESEDGSNAQVVYSWAASPGRFGAVSQRIQSAQIDSAGNLTFSTGASFTCNSSIIQGDPETHGTPGRPGSTGCGSCPAPATTGGPPSGRAGYLTERAPVY